MKIFTTTTIKYLNEDIETLTEVKRYKFLGITFYKKSLKKGVTIIE